MEGGHGRPTAGAVAGTTADEGARSVALATALAARDRRGNCDHHQRDESDNNKNGLAHVIQSWCRSLETVAADGYRFLMSDAPNITFNSVSKGEVSATYANLPPASRIVFTNKTSGQPFGGGIDASGSASVEIKVPSGAPAGDYYLEAQDSTGSFLAESVVFHVSLPPAE
jgi:hypothetical protein